jgi:hypothetical protein
MRSLILLPAVLLTAAPLAAQGFTGVITMRGNDPSSGTMVESKVYIDGDRSVIVAKMPEGPMAGQEMRAVNNPAAGRTTMFITMQGMPGMKGMKMVIPHQDGAAEGSTNISAKSLGTSQTIAGMRCDDYEVTVDGEKMNMCVTEALGRFQMSAMGAGGRGQAQWTRAFNNRNVFPLKMSTQAGVAMEVISIERGAVDASLFDENTPGYMNAPGMGRNQ